MHTPLPDHWDKLAAAGSLDSAANVDEAQAARAREAATLIKSCVHCGFCLPACPTYSLLGDERDSPRGRIYLIKQMAEGHAATDITRLHLDRCLTCRACETACPSGVRYGRLVDVGRAMVDASLERSLWQRVIRAVLGAVLANRNLFGALLRLGRAAKPVLPRRLARVIPSLAPEQRATSRALSSAPIVKTVVLHQGCVQPALAPHIDESAQRVLKRLGTQCRVAPNVCCGALNHHLGRHEAALAQIRTNVDVWTQSLNDGAEAIVSTASGCSSMIKDYGTILRDDVRYAEPAARVSAYARDLSETIEPEQLREAPSSAAARARVAWHAPCSLAHAQKIRGRVEPLLMAAGFDVREPDNASRCCGSAGTYSILQPDISTELRDLKVKSLEEQGAEVIATANIGCLTHLRGGTALPVRHWVELVDEVLG